MRTHSTFVLFVSVAALAVTGCRRDPGPSLEYVEAKGLHDRLIVNMGDDAYADPQMGEVESLLKRVENRSPDHEAAQTLLATIAAERERVEREAAAAARASDAPVDLSAAFERDEEEQTSTVEAEADATTDAGVIEVPVTGMAEAEFREKFSDCFEPAEEMLVTGVGLRPTFRLQESEACRARYKGFATLAVVIDSGKIGGFVNAPRPPPQGAEAQPQPRAPQQSAPAQPAAPQGPYAPPPPPQTDPNVTRPEATPAQTGNTADDYDGIKY